MAERKIVPLTSSLCEDLPPITGLRPVIGDGHYESHHHYCTLAPLYYSAASHLRTRECPLVGYADVAWKLKSSNCQQTMTSNRNVKSGKFLPCKPGDLNYD
ncbi:hypothetical protein AVEN_38632-1 [Araneus ventricosus]|uniref:Uncharacterized protein n=1 Tax=Araneus ventricosus TaxID=182803 RepID=A0A4Y2FJV1_ARAVE|nr:hypothetical protein AVEN_38632-1 [Araneus ventricosus]